MKKMKMSLAFMLLAACLPLAAGDVHGKVTCKGASDCADAVVYLGAIAGKTFPAPKDHPSIDQKNMQFNPRILAVQQGSTVDFVNSDPVLHNVFTPDACAEQFDLGLWPHGEVRSYTYRNECVVTLLCKVHHDMVAFIVVVPTPYFTMVKSDGSYQLSDVPDGAYTVKIWHSKLRSAHKAVTVKGSTEAPLELTR
ncbi:MAG TPA: plastocyanin/azurin family copper-binding protein [Thermoanaerobaculia bacterium]|nr:plastocyanin/azurin family copper-binding protein [Thermoanaerobaculia bacterium]